MRAGGAKGDGRLVLSSQSEMADFGFKPRANSKQGLLSAFDLFERDAFPRDGTYYNSLAEEKIA